MNITTIRLVLVGMKTVFVVMCKILMIVIIFECERYFNFSWLRFTTVHLDLHHYHRVGSNQYFQNIAREAALQLTYKCSY